MRSQIISRDFTSYSLRTKSLYFIVCVRLEMIHVKNIMFKKFSMHEELVETSST